MSRLIKCFQHFYFLFVFFLASIYFVLHPLQVCLLNNFDCPYFSFLAASSFQVNEKQINREIVELIKKITEKPSLFYKLVEKEEFVEISSSKMEGRDVKKIFTSTYLLFLISCTETLVGLSVYIF